MCPTIARGKRSARALREDDEPDRRGDVGACGGQPGDVVLPRDVGPRGERELDEEDGRAENDEWERNGGHYRCLRRSVRCSSNARLSGRCRDCIDHRRLSREKQMFYTEPSMMSFYLRKRLNSLPKKRGFVNPSFVLTMLYFSFILEWFLEHTLFYPRTNFSCGSSFWRI